MDQIILKSQHDTEASGPVTPRPKIYAEAYEGEQCGPDRVPIRDLDRSLGPVRVTCSSETFDYSDLTQTK